MSPMDIPAISSDRQSEWQVLKETLVSNDTVEADGWMHVFLPWTVPGKDAHRDYQPTQRLVLGAAYFGEILLVREID